MADTPENKDKAPPPELEGIVRKLLKAKPMHKTAKRDRKRDEKDDETS